LNGPPGLFLAAGKGVLRSMLMDPESIIEAIPVDTCISGMIVMVKHLATSTRSEEIPVYNLTLHESRKITIDKMFKHVRVLGRIYPLYGGLW
jgi:alcohol-forming fatty acyl-CoA reductase